MKLNALLLAGLFFLGTIITTPADILDTWTTNQIITNGYVLDSIALGNGCFVATAEFFDAGEIFSSPDGTDWTLSYSDFSSWGLNMHYVNGRFVGVGGGYGATAVSTNGTDWTISFLPGGGYINDDGHGDITYANGLYVQVGDSNGVGCIYTSSDGSNWTSRTSTTAFGGHIASVIYGPTGFVAVGNNDHNVYTSLSGISWTTHPIPGGSQISYGNYGYYIVPLNSKTNLYSDDGISWAEANTGLTNELSDIIYVGSMFYAYAGSFLATSTNGTNWFQYSPPLPGGQDSYQSFTTDGSQLATIASTLQSTSPSDTYNGYVYLSGPLVSVRITNHIPSDVTLSGLVGRNYQIQSATVLAPGPNNWRTNLAIQLINTPYVWTDPIATNSARFYRGVLLP